MLSMSSDDEEYSEIATPDLMNYDDKKLVSDKYGSISLCKQTRLFHDSYHDIFKQFSIWTMMKNMMPILIKLLGLPLSRYAS